MSRRPRVLVPRRDWPDDRFPQWAVDALRAAGATVRLREPPRPARWDAVVLPAVAPETATRRRLHAAHAIALLDVPARPHDAILAGADVVATSHALARTWTAGPVRVVPPAVAPAAGAAAGDGRLRVASAGPLHWSAGHEHAVAAVAELIAAGTAAELCVAGTGPAREAALFTAFDLDVEAAVTVTARSEREAVLAADAVVVAAVEDRAWPALLHAFACGVPAVASDLPTARELGGALLVPPREPRELAAALGRLASDPALRAELAARGRRAAATDLAACGRALLEGVPA